MQKWHLAELNVAKMKMPLDHPDMADFNDNLERINLLAEQSPGFIWRLKDEDGADATSLRPFGDDILVNLSVWESPDALRGYVYQSDHTPFLRRRSEWFDKMDGPSFVLWWIPAGHSPTEEEADAKRRELGKNGPTARAFTFAKIFDPVPETV